MYDDTRSVVGCPMATRTYRSATAADRVRAWCAGRLEDWPVPHSRTVVDTSAGQLHLLTAGPFDARPVVFLPGTNFSAASSLADLALLAERLQVVAVDLPGQPGLSDERRAGGPQQLASGIDELLEVLDRPVTLVGHSLGAAVALAARSPLVRARALLCPAGIMRLRTPPGVLATSVRWLARPSPAASRALLGRMSVPGQEPAPETVDWMTLVGRSVRSTLAPRVLPRDVLTRSSEMPLWVGAGVDDVFLPHRRLHHPVADSLGVQAEALPQGHLATPEAMTAVADWVVHR